jgi:hypothetical protein
MNKSNRTTELCAVVAGIAVSLFAFSSSLMGQFHESVRLVDFGRPLLPYHPEVTSISTPLSQNLRVDETRRIVEEPVWRPRVINAGGIGGGPGDPPRQWPVPRSCVSTNGGSGVETNNCTTNQPISNR